MLLLDSSCPAEASPDIQANIQYMHVSEETVSDFKVEGAQNKSLSLIEEEEDGKEEDEEEVRVETVKRVVQEEQDEEVGEFAFASEKAPSDEQRAQRKDSAENSAQQAYFEQVEQEDTEEDFRARPPIFLALD